MDTINYIKNNYGNGVQVDLVQLSAPSATDPKITDYKFNFNIKNVDGHIKKRYSESELLNIL